MGVPVDQDGKPVDSTAPAEMYLIACAAIPDDAVDETQSNEEGR